MDHDLFFDNRNFISVGQASEETGYTQDYIGQLSRASKIPARMVGRSWYVDKEAILGYSRQKKTNKFLNPNKKDVVIPVSSYVSDLRYENDLSPVLPQLLKNNSKLAESNIRHTRFVLPTVIVFAVFAFILTASVWINYASPRTAEILAYELSHISSDIKRVGSFAAVATNSGVVGSRIATASASGLVVFPDQAAHDQAVAEVEDSFSDDATVTFDNSGTSGVITPVFRKSDQADNYAFVMVPIKQTQ